MPELLARHAGRTMIIAIAAIITKNQRKACIVSPALGGLADEALSSAPVELELGCCE